MSRKTSIATQLFAPGLALGMVGLGDFDVEGFLLLTCVIVGFIFCIAGISLLYKQWTSPQTAVIELQLPFVGKVTTRSPSILLIVLGFVMVWSPVYQQLEDLDTKRFFGTVTLPGLGSSGGVDVFFASGDSSGKTVDNGSYYVRIRPDSYPLQVVAILRRLDGSVAGTKYIVVPDESMLTELAKNLVLEVTESP